MARVSIISTLTVLLGALLFMVAQVQGAKGPIITNKVRKPPFVGGLAGRLRLRGYIGVIGDQGQGVLMLRCTLTWSTGVSLSGGWSWVCTASE